MKIGQRCGQEYSVRVFLGHPVYHLARLLGFTGKNKAKTAVSVAVEAKLEVEIWQRPKKSTFFTLVSYSLLQTVFS